ncbi:hypothetical protein AGMMS50293_11650 [Spirochaetia bacterium]|nr:hypothetical protein AGMMS50293_11650 [Spirochaetia bacterium]
MMKRAAVILFILTFSISVWAAETSFYVNLQDYPLYLKAGFNPADMETPDLQDGSWQEFTQWTNIIISKLKVPGLQEQPSLPKRAFLSPFGRPEQEWTIVIPFVMESPPLNFPGLYLAAIGDNWQIYLNGVLVRWEMHRDDKQVREPAARRIQQHHSQRDVFFPIDRTLLNWRESDNNLLVFHIVGDPTDQTVGFQYSSPYYLADYEYISSKNSEILVMFLAGIFVLAGIYHFLIFALHRQSRYNCFCGIFSLFMGLYYLARTHNIYQLIPDTWIVVKLEFFFIFLAIPALGAYTEILCLGSIQWVTKIYSGLFAFLAVSQLFLVHSYGSDALIVWQILGIVSLLWILIHNVLLPFVREVRVGKKFGAAIWDTYSGNLLLGVSLFILSAIVDIINAMFFHYPQGFNRYTLCIFVLTMAVMLTRRYNRLNRELAEKSALLETAENPDVARETVFRAHDLTDREKEVARLIVAGLSNAEIAARLFVSESSIGFHITNIYRKFGVSGKINGRKLFLSKLMSTK